MTKPRHLIACAAALALLAMPARGLDAAERTAVVNTFADLLAANYVFPEIGRKLARALRAELAAGRFDAATGTGDFAKLLTQTAVRETNDKHMNVYVAPPADPNAPPPHPIGMPAQLKQSNHGFERVQRLAGNIGYLDLRYFDDTEQGKQVAAATMKWFARSDALIVDLRKNIGGEPDMVRFIQSFFFATPTLLNSLQLKSRPTMRCGARNSKCCAT